MFSLKVKQIVKSKTIARVYEPGWSNRFVPAHSFTNVDPDSICEHGIWEQFLEQEAVSTVKVLMKANEAGIPIFTVSSKNIDQVLPQLQVSEYVKTDIQNAVNKGHIVTIPKSNITINDWNGIGYVVLDPATGAAAYMISGGMAGGATTAIIALAAIAAAIIAIVDVVFAAGVVVTLSACAIGAFAVAWIFSLVVLALVSVLDDVLNHYIYHTEDNSEAFISDAIWALATLGALKCIKVLSTLNSLTNVGRTLAKAVKSVKQLDVNQATLSDLRAAVNGYPNETIDIFMAKFGKSYKTNPLRIEYENKVNGLSKVADDLRSQGKTDEEIARTVSQMRRDLGVQYKDATPPTLREFIYERNVNEYGDPLGPTFDWLIERYDRDYNKIIASSCRPNQDVDTLLGGFREWLLGRLQ